MTKIIYSKYLRYCFTAIIALSTIFSTEISGIVLDSLTAEPLTDCSIILNDEQQTTTDSLGQFFVPNELIENSVRNFSNTLDIVISHPNYHTEKIVVSVPIDSTLTIKLDPVIYPFKQVTIEGEIHQRTKINFQASSYQLNSIQLESTTSTSKAINRLPAIITKSYGGPAGISTVSLFGGQADRISILLDGIMLNSDQNGSADISQIPGSLIESLNFYPQGASAQFGSSAMTGVVNLVPKHDQTFYTHTSGTDKLCEDVAQFSQNSVHYSISALAGRTNYDGIYPWYEDGIKYDFFNNSLDQQYYYLHNSYQWYDSTEIDFQRLDVLNHRNLSGYLYTGPDISEMNDRLKITSLDIKKNNFSLQWNQKFNQIDYSNPPGPAPPVEAQHSQLTSNFEIISDFDEYLVHLKYRKEVSESTNSIDTSRIIVTVFTQLERYISKVKFIFALRNEFEKEHNGLTAGEATIRYKNGSTWDQSSVTLSSNYKRPGFNDLYWIPFGNPNLKLERSTNFSIRNKFNLRNSTLELSAFLIQYKDLIQWTPTNTGVVWSPENVPNAKSAGYHLFWEYQSNPVFRISVSLLKNDTQFNDPENNDLKSKSLRYAPEYILSINHSSFISGVFLMSSFKYVSEQIYFYDYPHDRTLPSYRIFNVGLSKKFGFDRINLIVVLNINNLFDLKYQSIHGYPEPGREINFKSTISKK